MLKTKDLREFRRFLESGEWKEAFHYAGEELRLEMLEKVEELLETAEVADRVVGEVLFGREGCGGAEGGQVTPAASALEEEG
jgi:hypothetical protein